MNTTNENGIAVKELREPLYDTFTAAAGQNLPARIQFFVNGKSTTKGVHLTNLNDHGKLPAPERMSVYRAPRVSFIGMDPADVTAIVKGYVCRMIVAGAEQFTGPLEYCAAGGGPLNATQPQNGIQSAQAVVKFSEELRIDIESGQKFMVELVTEGNPVQLSADAFIRVMLDGIHVLPQG